MSNTDDRSVFTQCFEVLKSIWWDSPLPESTKEKIFYALRAKVKGKAGGSKNPKTYEEYAAQVLKNQFFDNSFSINYPKPPFFKFEKDDPKFIAFYLPQYYPDKHNEEWWGKGSTEWTNVSKAAAQYIGQDQPKYPGELGFYDLRIQENIYRQIELAKIFGVYGFCFYYYWFDGERLLDLPVKNFVNDETIDFPFMICWANENWTKQWNGNTNTPLIKQSSSKESYKAFIHSCVNLFEKENYIQVNGKPAIIVYKPRSVPEPNEVISYWKKYVKNRIGKEPYVIASLSVETDYKYPFVDLGFDAVSEFAPGPQIDNMKLINDQKEFVCKEFLGKIYDYKDFVSRKGYLKNNTAKLFRAACPMWDNTARKKNKGMILDGANPELFNLWLKDIIVEVKRKNDVDEKFIFLNAWNEWAEGAYLEPDLKWKYGYLEAIRNAIVETRE